MPLYPGLCDPGGSGSGGHLAAADAGHSGYTPVDPSGPSDSYGPPAAASYGPPATSYGLPAASYGPTLGLAAGYGDGQATSVLLDSIAGHPLRPEQPQQQQISKLIITVVIYGVDFSSYCNFMFMYLCVYTI